jgi:hypothetical protein
MTEPVGKLERELLAMRPKALGDEVIDAIVRSVCEPSRCRGDWFLVGAMGSGLAAAIVIVAMLSVGVSDRAPSAPLSAAPVAQIFPQRAGDSMAVFARADGPAS